MLKFGHRMELGRYMPYNLPSNLGTVAKIAAALLQIIIWIAEHMLTTLNTKGSE